MLHIKARCFWQAGGNMPEAILNIQPRQMGAMGTKPFLEARSSQAAQNELRHDREFLEVETIYRALLPELIFYTHTFHRAHSIAERVQSRWSISIAAARG